MGYGCLGFVWYIVENNNVFIACTTFYFMEKVPSCDYLMLIPSDRDREEVLQAVRDIDCGFFETGNRLVVDSCGAQRSYEPHCTKKGCPCVAMESVVISQQEHGFGNFYQLLAHTLENSGEIEECPDRETSTIGRNGGEILAEFMIRRVIKRDNPDMARIADEVNADYDAA